MRFDEVTASVDNAIILTFKMPLSEGKSIQPMIALINEFNPSTEYILAFQKAVKKRSNNANAYMWVLCDKIASILHATKEEVYRRAIRDVGVFSDVAVQAGEPCGALIEGWAARGVGYFSEMFDSTLTDKYDKPMKRVRLYKGSHTYDSKQMSRLVDWVVSEAKGLGIETMTENELKELKEKWKAE